MPSGAALLCALAALLVSGFGRRAAASLGTTRSVLAAWCLLAAGASALNLQAPRILGLPWEPLVNPGGTLVPAAFTAFVAFGPGRAARRAAGDSGWADVWAALAGALAGVTLAAAVAWDFSAGLRWPGIGCGVLVGAALALGPGGSVRVTALSAAVAVVAAGLGAAVLAAAGWVGWPAAVGGGRDFDVAVMTLMVAGVAHHLPAVVRAGAVKPLRGTIPERR